LNLLEAVVLGLVQGLTEYLPVSSTAHLLVAQRFFGMEKHDLHVEMATHLGTVLAVVVHYRALFATLVRDVVRGGPGRRVVGLVVLATAMLVVAIGVRKLVPGIREWRYDLSIAALGLIGVGLFLIATKWAARGERDVGPGSAVGMGLAQCAAAIVPGCSRSGSTIGTGLFLGVDPAKAAAFSFLMSIPAVIGGSLYELKDGPPFDSAELVPMLVAGVVAFASGLAAIRILLAVVGRGHLHWFGVYCLALGTAVRVWGQG
jgi:undecaprenyl-diphosphatase